MERFGRTLEHAGLCFHEFPSADVVAEARLAQLRECGLSARKAESLRSVARSIAIGELSEAELTGMTTDGALQRLCELPGIGPWSASLVLLRGLGRLEVFPPGDIGAANRLESLLHLRSRASLERVIERFGRYRGVLSLVVVAWAFYYVMAEYRKHAALLAAAAPTTTQATDTETAAAPQPAAESGWQALGQQVFGNYCAACHQLTGEGVPSVFPPLRGDPVVTAIDPEEHIRVILGGLSGKAIGGVTYASPMPPLGAALTDEQIAAVANHERTAWGNAAPTVTAADVSAIRAAAAGAGP